MVDDLMVKAVVRGVHSDSWARHQNTGGLRINNSNSAVRMFSGSKDEIVLRLL